MNWGSIDQAVLAHWRKLTQFRARHVALARGAHQMLSSSPYVFSRIDGPSNDRVVVALNVNGPAAIPVGSVFPEGQAVQDAYSGQRALVNDAKVSINAAGTVLLERAAPLPAR
jgi:alpha-amylase